MDDENDWILTGLAHNSFNGMKGEDDMPNKIYRQRPIRVVEEYLVLVVILACVPVMIIMAFVFAVFEVISMRLQKKKWEVIVIAKWLLTKLLIFELSGDYPPSDKPAKVQSIVEQPLNTNYGAWLNWPDANDNQRCGTKIKNLHLFLYKFLSRQRALEALKRRWPIESILFINECALDKLRLLS